MSLNSDVINVYIEDIKSKLGIYRRYCAEANTQVWKYSKFIFCYSWLESIVDSMKVIISFWLVGGVFSAIVPEVNNLSIMSLYDRAKWYIVFYVFSMAISYFGLKLLEDFVITRRARVSDCMAKDLMWDFINKINNLDLGSRKLKEVRDAMEVYLNVKGGLLLNLFVYQYELLASCVGIVVSFLFLYKTQASFIPIIALIGLIFFVVKKFLNDKLKFEEKCTVAVNIKIQQHEDAIADDECWLSLKGRGQHTMVAREMFNKMDEYFAILKENEDKGRMHYWILKICDFFFTLLGIASVIYLLWDSDLSFIKIGFVLGSFQSFMGSAVDATSTISEFTYSLKEYEKYKKFLDLKPLVDEDTAVDITLRDSPKIVLKKVSFAYPSKSKSSDTKKPKMILKKVDYVFKIGTYALTGINGCGKTTLLYLLQKNFLATKGKVLIDGKLISAIKSECLLSQVVYMTAQSYLPEVPIDIAVSGCERDKIDGSRLVNAIRLAGMEDYIKSIGDQLDKEDIKSNPLLPYELEYIGNWTDVTSSGQYQRFVLASMFYKIMDPKVRIVLLDEPVANCDPNLKSQFYKSLKQFGDKVVIVVLHDVSYFSCFDNVIVMADGKIIHNLTTTDEIESHVEDIANMLVKDCQESDDDIQVEIEDESK